MKKYIIPIIAAAVLAGGGAKTVTDGTNVAAKRFFDAWAQVAAPNAVKTALGSYIFEETPGTGVPIADSLFIKADYTIRTIDGAVTSTTSELMAKQLGSYNASNFYGPTVWFRGEDALYAGIEELIKGKNVGAHFQAAIPGWLCTTERYSTQEEYLKKVTGTDYIYDFTVTDAFNDIEKYELDSIVRYMKANYPEVDPADTVDSERNKYGLYYVCLKPSDKPDTTFADGAEVHLNYTGMRLDGTIFDTTDEKTAKDAGIYSAGSSYKPTYVKWKENYKEMTMGDSESSAIDGFLYAISHMKPHEKGIVIFHSGYGYGYNGHGKTIPGYSPLAFILELTDNE